MERATWRLDGELELVVELGDEEGVGQRLPHLHDPHNGRVNLKQNNGYAGGKCRLLTVVKKKEHKFTLKCKKMSTVPNPTGSAVKSTSVSNQGFMVDIGKHSYLVPKMLVDSLLRGCLT